LTDSLTFQNSENIIDKTKISLFFPLKLCCTCRANIKEDRTQGDKSLKDRYGKTVRLTGTAILAAMVIVFDYTLKFSGLKIPFPWLPFLKFDFTGVPIALSLLLYGLPSGGLTSVVACLGIIARSGDVIGSLMKGLAEFSTILGMALGLYLPYRLRRSFSVVLGLVFRVISMSVFNLVVLPNYYGMPLSAVFGLLPMIGVFNAMQGGITVLLGYFLYEAYSRRMKTN